jgi:1-acyl-sn-glycerol-3-phosphate acyltransferase
MKWIARAITIMFLKLFYRVEVVNKETIPEKGSFLLCANHNTILDMFFMGYKVKRWIYWMAKEELFKNPIAGFFLRSLGAFSIKRGKGDVGSIKTALKLLQDGKIVGIFPHGTRVKASDRKSARIRPGVAMLAVNSGCRVIPAAVVGPFRIFSRVKVIFGEPFDVGANIDRKYSVAELTAISVEIMKRVDSLVEAY